MPDVPTITIPAVPTDYTVPLQFMLGFAIFFLGVMIWATIENRRGKNYFYKQNRIASVIGIVIGSLLVAGLSGWLFVQSNRHNDTPTPTQLVTEHYDLQITGSVSTSRDNSFRTFHDGVWDTCHLVNTAGDQYAVFCDNVNGPLKPVK